MSCQEALGCFKIIGFDPVFEESLKLEDYVVAPPKPILKTRMVKGSTRNLRELSPGFESLTGVQGSVSCRVPAVTLFFPPLFGHFEGVCSFGFFRPFQGRLSLAAILAIASQFALDLG